MNTVTMMLLGLILLGAVIGFYNRKKLEIPVLRLFPYFLLFQLLYQLAASLYSFVFTAHASNHFIFNLSLPINVLYFGMLYHGILRNVVKRKIVVIGTILNLVFFIVNLLFIQDISFLMTYSRTAMSVSVVVYSLLYFHEIITDDRHNTNPLRQAPFWIVTSLFFFYLSSTLTIIFWSYFVVSNEHVGSVMLRVFAFLLYSMYIAGLLLHRPIDKT